MSHNWNCPSKWEAEREARYAAERDQESRWGRSYSDPYDCVEANRAYRDEYDSSYLRAEEQAQEERAAQRRAEQRRHEQEQEEEYYRQQAEEASQMEAAYNAAMERDYAEAMAREQALQPSDSDSPVKP